MESCGTSNKSAQPTHLIARHWNLWATMRILSNSNFACLDVHSSISIYFLSSKFQLLSHVTIFHFFAFQSTWSSLFSNFLPPFLPFRSFSFSISFLSPNLSYCSAFSMFQLSSPFQFLQPLLIHIQPSVPRLSSFQSFVRLVTRNNSNLAATVTRRF